MKKIVMIILLLAVVAMMATGAQAKWSGVDETVVEKYAEEHGRAAVDPLINTDQGDILLFVFLLGGAFGGALGGFMAGYCYRWLMEPSGKARAEGPETEAKAELGRPG